MARIIWARAYQPS